jgi:hypothetical protein
MKGDHAMKTRLLTQLPGLALAVLLTLLVGSAGANDGKLEGTWLNEVKIVTCPPAPFAVIAAFPSMSTYMRGGILIEGGGPPTPPPAVSRSAGHGIWERTDHRTFRIFFRYHGFDNLGRRVRIVEPTVDQSIINGDNPETPDVVEPYYLSAKGTTKITNINPVDGTVIVTQGCVEAISRPILFED